MRLRWRYLQDRPELYISESITDHRRVAKALKAVIEDDLIQHTYDASLAKYKELLRQAALQGSLIEDQVLYMPPHIKPAVPKQQEDKRFDIIAEFNNYLGVKGIKEANMPVYYYYTRQMLNNGG